MGQRALELVLDSTNVIELKGLKDEVTGTYPTDADVVATLLDANGDPVAGAEAIDMEYVDGTTGRSTIYRGSITHDLELTAGAAYTARVVATATDNTVRTFPVPVSVVALP